MLRYWLASLQLEEALTARPKARRPLFGPAAPRLDAPAPGHDYFKLALDADFAALVCAEGTLRKPLDAELGAFFEHWLVAQYRRSADDRDLAHMVAFPVIHLPRGELAGLLRYGVRLRFSREEGAAFTVPSRAQRRRGEYPPPPVEARLTPAEGGARQWPFFVDTRLLQQQLGVARESIDALFGAMRSQPQLSERTMLGLVCYLLESELADAAGAGGGRPVQTPAQAVQPAELLARITAAAGSLLARRGGRARVYPVGIVLDASRAKTTWYLQRDIQALLDEPADRAFGSDSCLHAYLTGAPKPQGAELQRALFPGPALSESQRGAAEACWGSRLCAVQGPPGTGKTTLILHLAAEALVRQVEPLAAGGAMGSELLVVTSTNNRAVDNVVDPLLELSREGLPLSLRAGSRLVCEHVLAPQLTRAREWLARANERPATERIVALNRALDDFRALRKQVAQRLSAREHMLSTQTRREALRHELEQLHAGSAASAGADGLPVLAANHVEALQAAVHKLQPRIAALCELCEAVPSLPSLQAVDRHHRHTQRKHLPALHDALAAAGLALPLGLPPDLPPSTDPAALMAVWEEAAQTALAAIEGLQTQLASAQDRQRRQRLATQLQQQLAALPAQPPATDDEDDAGDGLQQALFSAAVQLREAWAAQHAGELLPLVEAAIQAARGEGSLRPLFNADPARWTRFRQLFGLWGCTLLSLGNCLPAQSDAIAQLVIDEAGQCHPAYAVSALLRAGRALVIGDVNQLPPVIDLELDDDERVLQASKLALPNDKLEPYRVHAQAQCSVQRLADRAVAHRLLLRDHFRCQPEIIAICDALCGYGLHVHTTPQGPRVPLPFLPRPVTWVDVDGSQERLFGSWHNRAELEVTLEVCNALLAAGVPAEDIAVITPYRGQLEQLRRGFAQRGIPVDQSVELQDIEERTASPERGLGLGTVHRFQGGERSIVVFSCVVTQRGSLPFLDQQPNLLNVAVSRARHRLICVGRRNVLESGKRTVLLVAAAEPVAQDAFRAQLGLRL